MLSRKDGQFTFQSIFNLPAHLEHVGVVVMAVFHNHCLIPGESEGDAVLTPAVNRLKQKVTQVFQTAHGEPQELKWCRLRHLPFKIRTLLSCGLLRMCTALGLTPLAFALLKRAKRLLFRP